MTRDGDCYYVISSLYGYPIRRSCDGVDGPWEVVGKIFPNGSPQWFKDYLNTTNPMYEWAPAIDKVDGKWRVYYAGTTFGSQRSTIGLATADDIEGPWTDQGEVKSSVPGKPYNAIDPDPVWAVDEKGDRTKAYLAWGSWWSGLYIQEIGADGKPLPEAPEVHIASRAKGGLEAASVIHHDGYYYLFASYDGCCAGPNSTYNIRYGRSASVTGPYLDESGVDMVNGGGTLLLAGYGNIRGTGHQDVFEDDGTTRLVHHYYDRTRPAGNFDAYLQVRDLTWSEDGWPELLGPSTTIGGVGVPFINKSSELCLDAWEWNQTPGTVMRTATCNELNVQQWYVSDPGQSADDFVTITNRNSQLCVDGGEFDTARNSPAMQQACESLDSHAYAQEFQLEATRDGWFKVRNRETKLCLTAATANVAGSNTTWEACNAGDAQLWRTTAVPEERLPFTVTAATRCVAGKVVVAVTSRNDSDMAARLEVSTPYGSKIVSVIEPGKSVSSTIATRLVAIATGTVSVTATSSDAESVTQASFAARTCG